MAWSNCGIRKQGSSYSQSRPVRTKSRGWRIRPTINLSPPDLQMDRFTTGPLETAGRFGRSLATARVCSRLRFRLTASCWDLCRRTTWRDYEM
jgi:hypothetical protein